MRKTKRSKIEQKYKEWEEHRDKKEIGFFCSVKLICDSCGKRWVDDVRQTLPPCPKCGSVETLRIRNDKCGIEES